MFISWFATKSNFTIELRTNIDVNEHERLLNITLAQQFK